MATEQKYSDGWYDRALTAEEQASRDRPYDFETARAMMSLNKFRKVKLPDGRVGYVLKRPNGVDCIYDW